MMKPMLKRLTMALPRLAITAMTAIVIAGTPTASAPGALAAGPHSATDAHAPAGQPVLPRPVGPVILRVTGAIAQTNAPGAAEFDLAMLQELGIETIRTTTVWTEGVKTFRGIPGRSLLDRIGAAGASIDAVAVNDYLIVIPADDLRTKGAMLAFEMDGRPLTLRDKGPLWIVYPRDDHPELASGNYNSRWIWQLKSLQIR